MTGTTLSGDQGTELLRKLASDDGFRKQFEADPAAALASLGIANDTIKALSGECCKPRSLADKDAFTALLRDVNSTQFNAAMAMRVPMAKL